jgi:hypothetical protein
MADTIAPSPQSAAPQGNAAPTSKPTTLDDLMIAMDVVDTVRHRDDLVRRELNEAGREAELIERLKQIYRDQGIEVPDHVLAEGVKALKESRFRYTPPPPSLKRSLLTLWATRDRYKVPAALAAALLIGGGSYHYAFVARPAQQAEQATRVELTETLPAAVRRAHADVLAVGNDPEARRRADLLLADGERAIRDRNRDAMTDSARQLTALRDELARDFTLTIVSRPGETSGVWRRPPRASGDTRNYYLIVEAITTDGRKLSLPIRNEETGATETVEKFGVRVPQATFESVAIDKRDDGIIQKNRYAMKKRGVLALDYMMPFEGGMITRW